MSGQGVLDPVRGGLESERIIGIHDSGHPGPTVLVLGGIHGNEPAGIHACRRVLERLEREDTVVRGTFVALAGNLAALRRDRRFLDRDLNRRWLPEALATLVSGQGDGDGVEDREQRGLFEVFERFTTRAGEQPLVFLDLHTSSAEGPPFSCLADTLPNRRLAARLPVPMILGLEECIDGAVMEYFNQRGLVAVAVEGGRHRDGRTIDNLEAMVWLTLVGAGVLVCNAVDTRPYALVLEKATRGLPSMVEVRYRHSVIPEDCFVMGEGFRSFEPVAAGALLARDDTGQLSAREAGRVLLPLYQGQGEDGYFLVRDIRPFWLGVSTVMRRLGLAALAHWLPGVRRDPDDPLSLLVNRRVARFYTREIFHLLGFRRRRPHGELLRFSRRWSRPENDRLGPVDKS